MSHLKNNAENKAKNRKNDMSTEDMIEKIRKASGLSDHTKMTIEHGFRQRVSEFLHLFGKICQKKCNFLLLYGDL